jgi:hypothetical protein
MNRGARGISYTHFSEEKFSSTCPWRLCACRKISIKKWQTHLLWFMPRHLSQGVAATSGAMSPIQARQAPTNQSVTHGLHMDPWAHPKEAHPEGGPPGIRWPLDRPNWPWVGWSRASTWFFPIGPRGHYRGVSLHLTLVLRPINRRGGGSFLTNPLYSSSPTFGF